MTTTTGYDGTFTLSNVPVGNSIPLVIQLGRWRRQFVVNINNSCGVNQVNDASMPVGILKMPHNQGIGDIPLTAISTGDVDAMECVLLKMGIDAAEFTTNAGTGRVHIYQGNGAGSSVAAAPNETQLTGRGTPGAVAGTWNNYDQILFPCWGSPVAKNATALANLITYADTGGHFFATHYSYTWLNTNAEFQGTAQWDVNANNNINSTTGIVSQLPPTAHPAVFVNWLNYVHALSNFTSPQPIAPPNPADVTIAQARHNVDTVLGNSTSWITGTDPAPGGLAGDDAPALHVRYAGDPAGGRAPVRPRHLQRLPRRELGDRHGKLQPQQRLLEQQLRRRRKLRRGAVPQPVGSRDVLWRHADDVAGEGPRVYDLGPFVVRSAAAVCDVHADDLRELPGGHLRRAR